VSWKVGAISRAGRLLCFGCLGLVDRLMRKAYAQDCRLPSDGSPEHIFFFFEQGENTLYGTNS
jgi:hypothetical protein